MSLVGVDADLILYRMAWVCEYSMYHDLPTGSSFRGIKKYKDSLKEQGREFTEGEFEIEDILEPVSNALDNILSTDRFIKERTECKDPTYYLSGSHNFRQAVATIQPYKDKRPPKPQHYAAVKDFLINEMGGVVVDNIEADDQLAIMLSQNKGSICVSYDKDLRQVPGIHFDWVNDEFVEVDEEEAMRHLYTQIIAGDSTDNILGIKGFGMKKAEKAIAHCWTEREMFEVARDLYMQHYDRYGSALLETARLVYLLRSEEDDYRPPKI